MRTKLMLPMIVGMAVCGLLVVPATSTMASRAVASEDIPGAWGLGGGPLAPPSARVELSVDKKQYFLGENILVHYCLVNDGKEPLDVYYGGDSGAHSEMRFKVIARDFRGRIAPDPNPEHLSFGGLMGTLVVKPGERLYRSIPIMNYCTFPGSGVYTITIQHDLGWREDGTHQIPSGQTTFEVLMPDVFQARQVVQQMDQLRDDRGRWGEKSPPYANFSALRYPIYLPILSNMAEHGSLRALQGLAASMYPDATRELIHLLGSRDSSFDHEVENALDARLAPRDWNYRIISRPGIPGFAKKLALQEKAWTPNLELPLRTAARKLLSSADEQGFYFAAQVFGSYGRAEDLPFVLDAINRALPDSPDVNLTLAPRWTHGPRASNDLLSAAEALVSRGAAVPAEPQHPAEIALYVLDLSCRKGARPPGWQGKCARWVRSDIPIIREVTLRNMPFPAPAGVLTALPNLLVDPADEVKLAACKLVESNKITSARNAVLEILRTAREDTLMEAAGSAAIATGGYLEYLNVCADRLDEPGMTFKALIFLSGIVRNRSEYGSWAPIGQPEAHILKGRWMEFLRQHASDITARKSFSIGDPALLRNLFPQDLKEFRVSDEEGREI